MATDEPRELRIIPARVVGRDAGEQVDDVDSLPGLSIVVRCDPEGRPVALPLVVDVDRIGEIEHNPSTRFRVLYDAATDVAPLAARRPL